MHQSLPMKKPIFNSDVLPHTDPHIELAIWMAANQPNIMFCSNGGEANLSEKLHASIEKSIYVKCIKP